MARDPKEAAMMKIGQQRERDSHADRYNDVNASLTQMQNARDKREDEQARKSNGRMMSADAKVKRRVAEKAKVDADERRDRKAMNERHQRENEEHEKGGKMPARYAKSPEQQKINQNGLNPRQKREYDAINAKYDNDGRVEHNAAQDRKSRFARYKSDAMLSKARSAELAGQDEVGQKKER